MNCSTPSNECKRGVAPFLAPAHHKTRTHFQEEAKLRVRQRFELKHKDGRKIRSEFASAIQTVVECLIHYTHLATQRVGFPSPKRIISYTYKYLVERCGMEAVRFRRVMVWLRRQGYITTKRHFSQKGREVKTIATDIKLNITLFIALGFGKRRVAREFHKALLQVAKKMPELLREPAKKILRSTRRFARNALAICREFLGRAPPNKS